VNETKQRIPKGAVIAIAVVGVLLVFTAGYFMLISPQRAKIAAAKKETAHVKQEISDLQATTAKRKAQPKIRYASLYQITKSMPDSNDMADVMLALVAIGHESGITFTKVGSAPVMNLPLYQQLPIQLSFAATYYQLSDFLYRLRSLVRVRNGELFSFGRLYTIDHIDVAQPPLGYSYPTVSVSLEVSAFVYGSATAPPPGATTTTGTDTSSTDTTSTSTDTTATTTEPTSTAPPPALKASP
jgi:Tfp pilus assembly protein PilO